MGRESWSDRNRVEECRVLGITDLRGIGVFDKGVDLPWALRWTNSAGDETASISCMLIHEGKAIRFNYSFAKRDSGEKEILDYYVEIVTTTCNFGGERRWFICPLIKDGVHCGRRVGKLYLPPGGEYFGCRICHNLTYRSCQEHDKRVSALMRQPGLMLAKLHSPSAKDNLQALKAWLKLTNLGGK